MARAEIILSDSGGVQEEAPALGKPVLILRDATERPEGIKAGANLLVGRRSDKIVMAVERLLLNSGKHKKHIRASFPFGKGDTAVKVVKILKSIFST